VKNRIAFIGIWFFFVIITSTTFATGNSVSLDTPRQSADTFENGPRDLEILKQFWLNIQPSKLKRRTYSSKLMAKAQPDECFYGIGENNIYPFDFDSQRCWGGKPKVNESYVFGLTKSGKNLWFGTAPNMGCLVYAAIADQGIPGGLVAMGTNLWVCEYGEGLYGKAHDLPPASGDWRPPSIYIYNTRNNTLKQKIINDPLIFETLGLRAAGSSANVVFLAGPSISGIGGPAETDGINMFAFHARSGDFLGSCHFSEYKNIRKWVVANGVLYAGVANNKNAFTDPSKVPAGAIIRWQGNAKNPFIFEVVGWVDGDAAELAVRYLEKVGILDILPVKDIQDGDPGFHPDLVHFKPVDQGSIKPAVRISVLCSRNKKVPVSKP